MEHALPLLNFQLFLLACRCAEDDFALVNPFAPIKHCLFAVADQISYSYQQDFLSGTRKEAEVAFAS